MFTTPGLSGPSTGSIIRAPGRLGDARKNWFGVSQMARALGTVNFNARVGFDRLNALKDVGRPLAILHPFKIYNLPSVLRDEPDLVNDWRKFRIRAGAVNTTVVSGTDGHDADPDSEAMAEADMTDITIASGTPLHWFWIDATDLDAPVIDHDDDGSQPIDWSQQYIPIGYVDTDTGSADKIAFIRQYVRTDLFVCP